MTYKAVTRIKTGKDKQNVEWLERGDEVTASDVGGKEALEELVAAGSVMDSKKFDASFPEQELLENQPTGTPSNLEQVEGTTLQPEQPEPAPAKEATPVNPADPPKVEDAGTAKGFDTKGKDK